MWYVIGKYAGTIAWWGAYEDEKTADEIAQQVSGTAVKIKDLRRLSEMMAGGGE